MTNYEPAAFRTDRRHWRPTAAARRSPPLTPLRILLVEDNAVISALVGELLVELGHAVCYTARTEMDAIDAAARHVPDLMIVDAHLLMGNGIAAMAAILKVTAMPHIYMTGAARQVFPHQAIVLYKPFGTADLRAALERVGRRIIAATGGSAHAEP